MAQMTPVFPETTVCKRIVIAHRTGHLAGLSQILGITDDLPNKGVPLPEVESYRRPDGVRCSCSLISVTPRAVYYREIAPPERMGRFMETQQ